MQKCVSSLKRLVIQLKNSASKIEDYGADHVQQPETSSVIFGLQFPLRAWQLADDARVTLASDIHGARKRFKQRLDDVMRLVTVKQFQMQITAGFIGESLKKFAREAKAKCAGHVLQFFRAADAFLGKLIQAAPDQMRSSAKINDATREALVHWNVSLTAQRIFRMKPGAVTPNATFVAKRLAKRLAKRQAAVFDSMMRIHLQIPNTTKFQIHNRVFRKQRQHVVEEHDSGRDRGFAPTVKIETDMDAGFFGFPRDFCLPGFHCRY
jgi:hypothetical protein